MLNTRQIIKKFNVSKSQIDHLIRTKKNEWGLIKGKKGIWMWDENSIQNLENYIRNSEVVTPQVIVNSGLEASIKNSNEELAMIFARAVNERLEEIQTHQTEQIEYLKDDLKKSHQKEIEELKFYHKREIQLLREEIRSHTGNFDHKISIILDRKDRELVARDKILSSLESRTERRWEPITWFGKFYKKIVLEIFIWKDRRQTQPPTI